jgi:ferredoxin
VPVGKAAATEPAWYLARNKQRVGPLSFAQLRELAAQGELSRDDMVVQAGAQKWVAAGEVHGLFPQPAATPAEPEAAGPCSFDATPLAGELVSRYQALAEAQVVPDAVRCVQCGCCSYNCPIGIDVRAHARRGRAIHDSRCLTCGECVKRCPRGVLSFERISLLKAE